MVLLGVYAAWVGTKEKVKLESPRLREMGKALWVAQVGALHPGHHPRRPRHGAHVARRERRARRALHAAHRGLRLQGPLAEEGPAAHRQGVDEPRGRDHPHPGDGQRAHQLRRPAAIPAKVLDFMLKLGLDRDVAVPDRDERLPARPRDAHGGVQRDPRRGAAHPAVRGAVQRWGRSTWR